MAPSPAAPPGPAPVTELAGTWAVFGFAVGFIIMTAVRVISRR